MFAHVDVVLSICAENPDREACKHSALFLSAAEVAA